MIQKKDRNMNCIAYDAFITFNENIFVKNRKAFRMKLHQNKYES